MATLGHLERLPQNKKKKKIKWNWGNMFHVCLRPLFSPYKGLLVSPHWKEYDGQLENGAVWDESSSS